MGPEPPPDGEEAAAEMVAEAIRAGRLDHWLVRLSGAIKARRTERNREAAGGG